MVRSEEECKNLEEAFDMTAPMKGPLFQILRWRESLNSRSSSGLSSLPCSSYLVKLQLFELSKDAVVGFQAQHCRGELDEIYGGSSSSPCSAMVVQAPLCPPIRLLAVLSSPPRNLVHRLRKSPVVQSQGCHLWKLNCVCNQISWISALSPCIYVSLCCFPKSFQICRLLFELIPNFTITHSSPALCNFVLLTITKNKINVLSMCFMSTLHPYFFQYKKIYDSLAFQSLCVN